MFDLKNSKKKNDTNLRVLLLQVIIGKFYVPIPIATPFVHMRCSTCHLTHIIRQDDGMFFFCYACNITTPPCVLEMNVKHRIVLDNNNPSHIDVTFEKGLDSNFLNDLDEATFLSMHFGKTN